MCVRAAFRADGVWTKAAPQLHESLPVFPAEAIPEVSGYFVESWGNRTRIDYGSGMELNFLCWLSVSSFDPSCLRLDGLQTLPRTVGGRAGERSCSVGNEGVLEVSCPHRSTSCGFSTLICTFFFKIRPGNAYSAIVVLARTCWFAWGLGSGRLPFLAVFVWVGATAKCALIAPEPKSDLMRAFRPQVPTAKIDPRQ